MRLRLSPPRVRRTVAGVAVALVACGLLAVPAAQAAPAPPAKPTGPTEAPAAKDRQRKVTDPDKKLGKDWRKSADRAVTVVPSPAGLRILAAEENKAYEWRQLATLADPAVETDLWIGQACLTGDGRSVVAVFAPRQYANREQTSETGGYAAVVDVATGSVRHLRQRVSLAYYNPGCGRGAQAVLTTEDLAANGRSVLHVVNTKTGAVRSVTAAGQLTSAVPTQAGIVAADGNNLVQIDAKGARKVLAGFESVPHSLRVDRTDGIALLTTKEETSTVWRAGTGAPAKVGTGRRTEAMLHAGDGGEVFVVGAEVPAPPSGWHTIRDAKVAAVSSKGRLGVRRAVAPLNADNTGHVEIDAVSVPTGSDLAFALPALSGSVQTDGKAVAATAFVEPGEDTAIDLNRTCAVARNDPKLQSFQPTGAQVEWAVDLAVQGQLTSSRQANYLNWGLPAYTPQGMFPQITLNGGGRIPAQVMLGILAQESNLWQASWHALEGLSGNSLIGDFYGTGDQLGFVDFSKSDCGYGIGQVTTGMRAGDTYWTSDQKKAIAVDYQANIAASLRMLASKWNETKAGGVYLNDGNPSRVVNWFFAIWAYNTGFYAYNPSSPTQPWGVGWSNNPVNPRYPATRPMFLYTNYDDARFPNKWPYPERVMGWATTPIMKKGVPAYAKAAYYNNDPSGPQPDYTQFCVQSVNECIPGTTNPNDLGDPAGPCTRRDLKCWWHAPTSTVANADCSANRCGSEVLTYSPGTPEPSSTNPHPCVDNLVGLGAANAVSVTIVDNVPYDVRPQIPGSPWCHSSWSSGGTFSLRFAGTYDPITDQFKGFASKADFHQIGSGFGGHFWFAHSYSATGGRTNMRVTGTWNPTQSLQGWHRVMAHIPSHGAHTQQATYKIYLGNGQVKTRVVEQRREKNEWVSLGVFNFVEGSDDARVELSNIDAIGDGTEDVNFDAVAFAKLPAKPKHFIVGMGDSYASGEGSVDDFEYYSDNMAGQTYGNSCRRSTNSYIRGTQLPGTSASIHAYDTTRANSMDFHFVACSGASTYEIVPKGVQTATGVEQGKPTAQQYRWVTQLDSGYLDENTTLVTLTLGGNDTLFVPILEKCVLGNCMLEKTPFGAYDEEEYMEDTVPLYIRDYVKPSLITVLQQIKMKAPNAKIVMMAYPRLFGDEGDLFCADGMDSEETAMLNGFADTLKAQTQAAITESGLSQVYFADPTNAFINHAVCADDEYLNGFMDSPQSPGDDSWPVSMNSFHPNDVGHGVLSGILRARGAQPDINYAY